MKTRRMLISWILALGFLFILLMGVSRAAPDASGGVQLARLPATETGSAVAGPVITTTDVAPLDPTSVNAGTFTKIAPAIAHPGDIITYQLVVQNTNPDACSATVQDLVPEGTAYIGHLPPLVYISDPSFGVSGDIVVGVGETLTMTWWVSVTADISASILNTATISSDQPISPITATVETLIVAPAEADITATKMAPIDIFPDEIITYDIVIRNTGDVSGDVEFMQDLVPDSVVYVWHEPPLSYTAGLSESVSWSGSIEPGESLTLTWGGTVSEDIGNTILNQAVFYGDEPFTATAETLVIAPPDWHKWVDGELWHEGFTITTETSDTITVVDVVSSTISFDLLDRWSSDELVLQEYQLEPPAAGSVDVTAEMLTLQVPSTGGPQVVTMTKWFRVEPCTWTKTILQGELWVAGMQQESRPVTITKLSPDLHIDSDYETEATIGQAFTFTQLYSNTGGYEDGVMIRNEFPITAPFSSATPTPEREGAGGLWTEWDIGDLAEGDRGSIDVTIIVSAGVAPSSTIEIWGGIYDHVGELKDEIFIHPKTVVPPCSPVSDVSFTWDPLVPVVNQTVAFEGSASGDPPIVYTWDFGDVSTGTGKVVSYTFAATGIYTVTLTAVNECGAGTDEAAIEVVESPPPEIPNPNLGLEPEIKPPTCCCCAQDNPHLQGIDTVDAKVCAKCCTIGDYAELRADTGVAWGSGAGVYLHSGEFYVYEVDLEIPGRGFDWKFERKYRSGITYDGPLGHNWQLNYNQYLVVVTGTNLSEVYPGFGSISPGDVLRVDGYGRVDVYTATVDGFQAPIGFYTQLTQRDDGSFEERDYRGITAEYAAPDGQNVARMTALSDRDGNSMLFEYDGQGRLVGVLDTLGRPITYTWNAQDRLLSVKDFTGRQITFDYDGDGNLVEVTSPPVIGTPTGNDFPLGKTTRYTYTSGYADPVLNHNLNAITAPNEVATAGSPRIQMEYDSQDRAVIFTIGGTNDSAVPAGGTITYTYHTTGTTVFDRNGNRTDYQFNGLGNIVNAKEYTNRGVRPTGIEFYEIVYGYAAEGELTQQTHPEGNTVEYVYDEANPDRFQQGNLVAEIHRADPARGGDQEAITITRTYEPIYHQVRTVTGARGNDPDYKPQNGGAWSPERYTTIYTFDYEEGCDFAAIAARIGFTTTEVQQRLAAAGMCLAPLGDVNGDGVTDQINGNVIRTIYPTATLLAGSNQALVEGDTAQEIVELYTYNPFGQRLTVQDPEGNVDVYEYYPERDPNGDGVIDNPTGDPDTGGYLKQVTRDTVSDPGRNSATNPTPVNIRYLYEYDAVGNVTRQVDGRGIATDYVVNELNQVVQVVRAVAHDVFTSDPAEPLSLTDFQYLENTFYDANDNVIRLQVEDRDDTSNVGGDNGGSGTAFVDYVYAYDILDNQVQVTEEVSNTLDLVTRYRYDPNGNQVLSIQPEGNAIAFVYDERDLLFQDIRGVTFPPAIALLTAGDPIDYDVRGGLPSTTTYHYDLNRNVIETVDAADTDGSPANNSDLGGLGDRTRYIYDGFGRRTSVVDSVGNQTVYQYDPAGNVVRVTHFGPVGGASPTSDGPDVLPMPVSSGGVIQVANLVTTTLLAATDHLYDEPGRIFQIDGVLFVNTVSTTRPPDVDDGDLTPDDDQQVTGVTGVTIIARVTARSEYDRNSRRTFTIEDDKDTYRALYDGVGREIKAVDPEGNVIEIVYDDNDNVIETQETDVSQVAGVPDEIFLTTNFYDSLDRLQRGVNNVGQTFDYRYDSRDNLAAMADAQGPLTGASITRRTFSDGALTVNDINDFGNVTIYFYDGINRETRKEIVLTTSGEGDGVNIGADIFGVKTATPTPDLTRGGGDGLITIRYDWDSNSLLTSLADDNGNQTRYTYDNLDRRLAETKGLCTPPALADRCDSPTTITYEYDLDGNLFQLTDENGSVTSCQFDAINRRAACAITRAPGVVGTTAGTYEYDGLSRMTRATDNNEPGDTDDDSTITYAYDSLSRVIEETQRMGSLSARATSSAWRAENLRTSLIYPNGRKVAFTFDRLDRIETIGDIVYTVYLPIIQKGTGAASSQLPDRAIAAIGSSWPANSTASMSTVGSIAEYTYIGPARVLERAYANGVRLTYLDDAGITDVGYDGLRRPVQLRHLRADNSLVVGFTHTYDRMNNKLDEVKLHDTANSEEYDYDSAYRLTDFDRPDAGAITSLHSDWMLDGVGNWQQVDGETREHSSFNEIVERSDGGVTAILSDDNGNETDDGTYTFEWDYRNRLRTVTRKADSALVAVYSYDVAGRRIRKVVTNSGALDGDTDFYYDGWQVVEERDGADALVQQYVYGVYIDEPLVLDRNLDADDSAIGPSDQRVFYHQNTLYSVFGLTGANAELVEAYQYDAYGRQTVYQSSGNGVVDFGGDDVVTPGGMSALGNPYLFTGRRYDSETGWYHYRTRYLDPLTGRFTTRDVIGIWGDILNLGNGYTYAGSNPASAVDPLGLNVTLGRNKNGDVVPTEINGETELYRRGKCWGGTRECGKEQSEDILWNPTSVLKRTYTRVNTVAAQNIITVWITTIQVHTYTSVNYHVEYKECWCATWCLPRALEDEFTEYSIECTGLRSEDREIVTNITDKTVRDWAGYAWDELVKLLGGVTEGLQEQVSTSAEEATKNLVPEAD